MFSRSVSFMIAGAIGAATLTAASAPSPLYPVYQRLWGFSSFTLTVVFAVYVFALLGALLTVGSLSDRLGRRPVACAALVLLAVGMVLFSIAGGAGELMIARVVQGFAVGAATSTVTAMILDSAPNPPLGSIVSSASPALGTAIGSVAAGALVQFAPDPRQLVFWLFALVYLTLAVLVWFIPERVQPMIIEQKSIWRSLRPSVGLPPTTRPAFIALIPSMAATWALAGLYLSLGSSILSGILHVHSHFVVGLVLGLFFCAGVIGSVASTALPPRQRESVGHSALVLGVLTTIAALLIGGLALYLIGSVVAGLGFGAAFRFAVNAIGDAAPPARRGQVFAAMYLVSYLAFSLPALIAGLAAERSGLRSTAVGYGGFDVALVLIATSAALRQRGNEQSRQADSSLRTKAFGTPRHKTQYLESGPADGPLMIFLHGWPSMGLIWRAHLEAFAAAGWHCVAPDLRGFGGSSAPAAKNAYAIKEIVTDLVELHDHLGGEPAIWVGHDWGSIVAGSVVAHEPSRSRGVVLTSWAYFPEANSLSTLVSLVDRTIYPADEYPDGQWDYYRYYNTHFDTAVADLDADVASSLATIYRSGRPDDIGRVAPTATLTRNGGRFGSAHRAPPTEPDPSLWPAADFQALVQAFDTRGFRPSSAWYTNDDANIAYAATAPDQGRLRQPVLFVNGEWDAICSISGNRQGDPMRAACLDLTVANLPSGHWLPLERKAEHIQAIQNWLQAKGF